MLEKLGGFKDWLLQKGAEVTVDATTTLISSTGKLIVNFEGLFVIVAIIGVYFIIADNKKLGTKLSSGSILIYLLGKVLSNVH